MRCVFAAMVVVASSSFAVGQEIRELFDGRTLAGWDGDERHWRVEDGVIVGRSTAEQPLERSTWLIWRGGEVADFELEFDFKLVGGNSGLQFRSRDLGEHRVAGYQADLEDGPNWTGCLYEQEGRGVMARRGETLRFETNGARTVLAATDGTKLLEHVRAREWNTYRVVARGPSIELALNGVSMTKVTDLDGARAATRGILAFQLHQGPPMEVSLRNVRLREFAAAEEPAVAQLHPNTPKWIWTNAAALQSAPEGEKARFRTDVKLERAPKSARLNGAEAFENEAWETPGFVDVAPFLRAGDNTLAIEARNEGGPAGVELALELEFDDGTKERIVTDSTWRATNDEAAGEWKPAVELAPLGAGPWGLREPKLYEPPRATPAEELEVPDGYRAELVYTVPRRKQGSWVAMCFDDRGRIIASDQYGPLYRVTLTNGAFRSVEELPLPLGRAQGLCFAFDALYAVVAEESGDCKPGLWRAKKLDDERFAAPELLQAFDGSGEHGPHAVVKDQLGDRLWIVGGNHTKLPELARSRVPKHWGEDRLLPQHPDPNGHAVGITAPGGWICTTDRDGKDWELFASGFRNCYDLAFGDFHQVFTFDSDMEWDIGLPWYRPTMIQHVVSGGDYGWRTGSWRWPAYYPDALPGVVDVGIASPTGMSADRDGRFAPELAGDAGGAIFAADWAYGTIYSVTLTSRGASYAATFAPFVKGKALPVTDMEFGPDGALYFLVGGRRAQSALYRVVRTETAVASVPPRATPIRSARFFWSEFHALELSPKLVERATADLDDPDRFVRHAARVALESADPSLWIPHALAERKPQTTIEFLIALAHRGGADLAPRALSKWETLEIEHFEDERLLDALRALELVCIRLGPPDDTTKRRIERRLLARFPHANENVNRELVELLVFFDDPRIVGPALARIEASTAQADRIAHLWSLRNLKHGWTLDQRARFFAALNELVANTSGGNSYAKYLELLRTDAAATLDDAERAALGTRIDPPKPAATAEVAPRGFVKAWKLDELVELAPRSHAGRDFERGKNAFRAASCLQCHRFDGEGGGSGPDLTGAGRRFGDRDLLEALVEPSRTISDLYRDTEIVTRDEELVVGRIEELGGGDVRVWPADGGRALGFEAAEIVERRPHALSRMPNALLDTFTEDEVLDLLAYLRSGGDEQDAAFAKER
jgi:putative heme-binding domain-containing protein